ncbi:hypothetical protein EBB07_14325 [Paenibacillaceae bacterium]|nr:hypothetical protein EBB07_14325 [Paenibacillaceae bacterium]
MNTETSTSTASVYERRQRKSPKGTIIVFLVVWLFLIASGVVGTMWYTEQTRLAITAELEQQTAQKIAAMQSEYEARLTKVEEGFSEEMTSLGSKVEALNELLTFTKDNANDKTDNSNMLYTQINDVKKKLDALQKSLDVLK